VKNTNTAAILRQCLIFYLFFVTRLQTLTLTTFNMTPERLSGLEINIVYACNLRCRFCSHFSDRLTGIVPSDEIAYGMQQWGSRLAPAHFRLLGGEPLLHPEVIPIIYYAKELMPFAIQRALVTNGLCLSGMLPDFWKAVRDTNTQIVISVHYEGEDYQEILQLIQAKSAEYGICYDLKYPIGRWTKNYQIDDKDNILPYKTDPGQAWQRFCSEHGCNHQEWCRTILSGKLFHCENTAMRYYARQAGLLGDAWSEIDRYVPLSPSVSDDKLKKWLVNRPRPVCALCPSQRIAVSDELKYALRGD
jgi:hypothetical protein